MKLAGSAVVLTLIVGCGRAPEEPAPLLQATEQSALHNGDIAVLQGAAAGLALQISLGALAPTHTATPAVLEFAHDVVELSTHGQGSLMMLAAQRGARLDTDLNAAHAARVNELLPLHDAAFDHAYVRLQGERLEEALWEVHGVDRTALSPEIEAFVCRSVPEIESLLHRTRAVLEAS